MNKRVYIKSKSFEFNGVMPEETIEDFMRSVIDMKTPEPLEQGDLESDDHFYRRERDQAMKPVDLYTVYIWEINTPRPRKNNIGVFELRSNYTAPTNNTMYDCVDCKEVGRVHEIKDGTPSKIFSDVYIIYKRDFTRRFKHCEGTYRICTGCGKHDGPWVPYGDD